MTSPSTSPSPVDPAAGSSALSETLALLDPAAGDFRLVDSLAPHLRVDDMAPHRGDGIFETVLVTVRDSSLEDSAVQDRAVRGRAAQDSESSLRSGHVHAREAHFARFRASAAKLQLPLPEDAVWDAAIAAVCADHIAKRPRITEFSLRCSLSRGLDGAAVGWILSIPVDPAFARQQSAGVTAVTLDRGYRARYGQDNPWALVGAKTLSYAVNQAAGRWALQQGADEALFMSSDGILLEGPTSNLVIQRGMELLTPDPAAGLLHGTTQQTLFTRGPEAGLRCSYADLTPEDLLAADAAWLTSSVRACVPLIAVDGAQIARNDTLGAQLNSWVMAS